MADEQKHDGIPTRISDLLAEKDTALHAAHLSLSGFVPVGGDVEAQFAKMTQEMTDVITRGSLQVVDPEPVPHGVEGEICGQYRRLRQYDIGMTERGEGFPIRLDAWVLAQP